MPAQAPLNLAIADGTPERIRMLCERENAQAVDAWLKILLCDSTGLSMLGRKETKQNEAISSPDLFIKQSDRTFVVEIKGDEEIADPAVENQKKYEYAVSHFERLNTWLSKEKAPIRYQLTSYRREVTTDFFN